MSPPDPGTALLLLLATLLIGYLGLWTYVSSWSREAAVAERTALDVAEARAARWRTRMDARLRRTPLGQVLAIRLVAAGVRINTVEFLLIAALAGVLGYGLGNLVLPTWLSVVAGLVGIRLCWGWVERLRNKRRDEFIQQLPDIARILSNASSAGLSIATAVQMGASELDQPAGAEMGMVAEELRLGQSLERALHNLEERMPSREVGVLISTLVIQQRAGGDLVRALQDMATTLEGRRDLNRELKTIMAGSVFTGYLVGVLGVGTILLMNAIGDRVIEKMTQSIVGQAALIVGLSLYTVGFLLIKRVTRVET